ncbi:MAG: hypothetical protein ACRERD_28155 [Candidatus Binatia bacterium]
MKFEKQIFEGQDILLDGNEFVDCAFTRCHLEFAGIMPSHGASGCTFNNCTWGFIGPANHTLAFLATLYGQGEEAQRLIENTFQSIRQNEPSSLH